MSRLPTPDEILAFMRENPTHTAKRDIARAFGLKGAAKVELKAMLARMTEQGLLDR
jgi:ribonuclease R